MAMMDQTVNMILGIVVVLHTSWLVSSSEER